MSTRFPSHVDLEPEDRRQLVDLLNIGLANSLDLYSQVKQAHWNVRGRFFHDRHELFDQIAARLEAQSDMIAERAAVLGGYANGTVRLAAHHSELPEYDIQATDGQQHVTALVQRFATHATWLRDAADEAAEVGDVGTEDLFVEVLREVEKDMWFLESHTQD